MFEAYKIGIAISMSSNSAGKFDVFKWLGLLSEYTHREMATHPEAIARQDIMRNMQHAFGVQGGRVASLLANPQAIELLDKIGARFNSVGGVQEIQQKFANESVAQQFQNAQTNFTSAMTEIGYTLLPLATRGLKALNTKMQGWISWITEHPRKVKLLAESFIGLGIAMAISGTVTTLTAGMRSLNMVMGATGLVSTITGVGGLLPGLLALSTVVAGLALTLNAIGPDKKDDGRDHAGQHWEREASGRSGHWASNLRNFGAHRGFSGVPQRWVDDTSTAGGHYEKINPVATSARPMAKVTVHTTLDRRGLSSMVAGDIAKASHQVLEGSAGTYDLGVLKPTIGMRGN